MDTDSSENYRQSSVATVAKSSTITIVAILALFVFLGILVFIGHFIYKTGSISGGLHSSVKTIKDADFGGYVVNPWDK